MLLVKSESGKGLSVAACIPSLLASGRFLLRLGTLKTRLAAGYHFTVFRLDHAIWVNLSRPRTEPVLLVPLEMFSQVSLLAIVETRVQLK